MTRDGHDVYEPDPFSPPLPTLSIDRLDPACQRDRLRRESDADEGGLRQSSCERETGAPVAGPNGATTSVEVGASTKYPVS